MFMHLLTKASLVWVIVWTAIMPVHAASLNWQQIEKGPAPAQKFSSEADRLANLKGNIAYVNGDLGAAILKIPGNMIGDVRFVDALASPVVFAQYDPQNQAGNITVMRLLRDPSDRSVRVMLAQFRPQDGIIFAPNFIGTNPFWQFKGGRKGSFMTIEPNAFWTAVGLVMRHVEANIGWIAVAQNDVKTWTTKSGGMFRKKVTTHMEQKTWPEWVMALPSGSGIGTTQGYLYPLCAPDTSTRMGQGPACDGGGSHYLLPFEAQTDKTTMTAGYVGTDMNPVTMNVGGTEVAAMKVPAGVSFVNQGPGNNLPHEKFVSFYRKETKSGWTGFAMIAFTAVLAGATAYLGAVLAPNSGVMTTLQGITGTVTRGSTALASAGVMAGMNSLYNVLTYGSAGYMDRQKNLIGGNEDGNWNPGVANAASYDVQQKLQDMYAKDFDPGKGTARPDPTKRKDKWDPRPSTYRAITEGAGNTPGGFEVGFEEFRVKVSQAKLPVSLAVAIRNGLQIENIGSAPMGTLPRARP